MSNADSCYVKLVDYDSDSGEDVTSRPAVTSATVGVGEKNVATSVSSSERIRRVNIVGKTTSSKSRETSGEAAATAIKAKILSLRIVERFQLYILKFFTHFYSKKKYK